jgi:hypothetical protein
MMDGYCVEDFRERSIGKLDINNRPDHLDNLAFLHVLPF